MRVVARAEAAYGEIGLRLEGGTALAAYHLGHRESEDLDFFGDPHMDARDFAAALRSGLEEQGFALSPAGPSTQGFARFLVHPAHPGEGAPIRLDLARTSPFRLAPLERTPEGIRIASYRDLCAGKLHAICDRFEPRDFIDLNAIVRHPGGALDADLARRRIGALLDDVIEIDPGLNPALVGQALSRGTRGPVVSLFPLRLLRAVSDDEVQEVLELAIRECARRVNEGVRGSG
jgi:hypothetical protein